MLARERHGAAGTCAPLEKKDLTSLSSCRTKSEKKKVKTFLALFSFFC